MILNTLRCQAGGEELTADSFNELYWLAQKRGWVIITEPGLASDQGVCPKHLQESHDGLVSIKAPPGTAWTVGCHTCEWDEDVWSESEAKELSLSHDCKDSRDDWAHTFILSPEKARDEAIRQAERNTRYDEAQRRKRAKDKEDAEIERLRAEARAAEHRYLLALAKEGERWLDIKFRFRHPIKALRSRP